MHRATRKYIDQCLSNADAMSGQSRKLRGMSTAIRRAIAHLEKAREEADEISRQAAFLSESARRIRRLVRMVEDRDHDNHRQKRRAKSLESYQSRLQSLPIADRRDVLKLMLDLPGGVTAEDIVDRDGKTQMVATKRSVIWRRLRDCGWSTPKIGKLFGFDHSTIVRATTTGGDAA